MTKTAAYKRLTAPKEAHASGLATLIIEFLGSQKLDTLFPPDELEAFLTEVSLALAGSDMLERLVLEGIDREAGDYPSEGETLKDWLPESVIKEMEAQARRGGRLPPDLAETVFGGELVKTVLGGALSDLMTTFVTKLPIAGLQGETNGGSAGRSSGLLGSLARAGASKLKEASSNLGLGALQETLEANAKEFAMQSTDRLRRAIGQRLTATEGGLADLRVEILHLILAFEVEKVWSWSRTEDRELAASIVRDTLKHAVATDSLGPERTRKHLSHLNQAFGETSLKAFLEDLGLWEALSSHIEPWIGKHLEVFFKTKEFKGWFDAIVGVEK